MLYSCRPKGLSAYYYIPSQSNYFLYSFLILMITFEHFITADSFEFWRSPAGWGTPCPAVYLSFDTLYGLNLMEGTAPVNFNGLIAGQVEFMITCNRLRSKIYTFMLYPPRIRIRLTDFLDDNSFDAISHNR